MNPNAVHGGFLPVKVKAEVYLAGYVYAIRIPAKYKDNIANIIPANLKA